MRNRIFLLAAALSLFASLAPAQTITASITGAASDPSGASVPGANVTATNTETNVRSTTTTNADGIYTFPFLRVGSYTITVEARGFKKSVVGPFTVETNQIARIDEGLWTDCPYAVVFKSPLHLTEIKERLTIPPSVAYWECHDSHYEFQAGFSSGESRHSVAGPLS